MPSLALIHDGQMNSPRSRRAIAIWLFVICGLVSLMILIGGLTRLTDSGLSITEWRPVTGAVPPLSEADWQDEFAKYQQIPEYKLVNKGMSLDAFKTIYWWEWTHRFLGRLIGFVFAIPFFVFLAKGWIARPLLWRLIILFGLGGLQGALGWFMVQSGLADRVDVSQYRLVAHLGLAFLIFAFAFWLGLSQVWPIGEGKDQNEQGRWARLFVGLVYFQILLGGFVAGTDAGLVYNTWPLMDGRLVPEGILQLDPWWSNFFENVTTIQFQHRIVAYCVAVAALTLWWRGRRLELPPRTRLIGHHLLGFVAAQITLGIITLLAAAPLTLSALHQTMAIVLFATAVLYAYALSGEAVRLARS